MVPKRFSFLVAVAALNGAAEAGKYTDIDQLFAYFDVNRDAEVTFSELGAGFSTFDKDQDGLISESELLQLPAARLASLCQDPRFKRYINSDRPFNASFFTEFDRNNDGQISQREWLEFFFTIASNSNLTHDQLTKWFEENASKVCPSTSENTTVPQSQMELIGGLAKPFREIFQKLDRNRNGIIEAEDLSQLFKTYDILKDRQWSRGEFNKALESNLLEYCYKSKKVWPSENCTDQNVCELKKTLKNRRPEQVDYEESPFLQGSRKLQASTWCAPESWQDVNWVSHPIKASQITTHSTTVYLISKKPIKGGYQIYRSENDSFVAVGDRGFVKVAVGGGGVMWAVDDAQRFWRSGDGGEAWEFVRGRVVDVAVGPDNSIFVMGGKKVNFGYSLKQYLPTSNQSWKPFPKKVRQIAVDREGAPWVISARRILLSWNGTGWTSHRIKASRIAIGGDGSVFILRRGKILKLEGKKWIDVVGEAREIAVDGEGRPLVIGRGGEVRWPEGSCVVEEVSPPIESTEENLQMSDLTTVTDHELMHEAPCKLQWSKFSTREALDVAAGDDGSVWIISKEVTYGGNFIYKNLEGGLWTTAEDKGAMKIALGEGGVAWIVDDDSNVFKRENEKWVQVEGKAQDIAANGSSVFILSKRRMPGGKEIQKYEPGEGWHSYSRGAIAIAVDPQGNLWYITESHDLYRQVGSKILQLPVKMLQISISPRGQVFGLTTEKQVVEMVGDMWKPVHFTGKQVAAGVRPFVIGEDGYVFQQIESCLDDEKVEEAVETVEEKAVEVLDVTEENQGEDLQKPEQQQEETSSSESEEIETPENPKQEEVKVTSPSVENPIYVGTFSRAPYQYLIRGDPQDNTMAETECARWAGGHLITIADKDEADFVSNMFPGKVHWIGLRQRTTDKGRFEWTDGESPTFSNWQNESLATVSGFDCTAVWPSRKWDHLSCSQKLPFICKRPLAELEPQIAMQISDRQKDSENNLIIKNQLLKKKHEQREQQQKQRMEREMQSQQKRQQASKKLEELKQQKLEELEQQKLEELELQKQQLKESTVSEIKIEEEEEAQVPTQESEIQKREAEALAAEAKKRELENWVKLAKQVQHKIQQEKEKSKSEAKLLKEASSMEKMRQIELKAKEAQLQKIQVAQVNENAEKSNKEQLEKAQAERQTLVQKLKESQNRLKLVNQEQKRLETKQKKVNKIRYVSRILKPKTKTTGVVLKKHRVHQRQFKELLQLTNERQKKFEQKLQKQIAAKLQKQKAEATKQSEAVVEQVAEQQSIQLKAEALAQQRLQQIKEMEQERQERLQKRNALIDNLTEKSKKELTNSQAKIEALKTQLAEESIRNEKLLIEERKKYKAIKSKEQQKKIKDMQKDHLNRLQERNTFIDGLVQKREKERVQAEAEIMALRQMLDKERYLNQKFRIDHRDKAKAYRLNARKALLLQEENQRKKSAAAKAAAELFAQKQLEKAQALKEKFEKEQAAALKAKKARALRIMRQENEKAAEAEEQREKERVESEAKIMALKVMLERERVINEKFRKEERAKAKALKIKQAELIARKAEALKEQQQRKNFQAKLEAEAFLAKKRLQRAEALIANIERRKVAALEAKKAAARKAKRDALLKAKEAAALKAKQVAALKEQYSAALRAKYSAALKAIKTKQAAEKKAKQAAALKAEEAAALKAKLAAVLVAKEAAVLKANQAAARKAKEATARNEKLVAEYRAKEAAALKAKEDETLRARAAARISEQLVAEFKAKEAAALQAKEAVALKAKRELALKSELVALLKAREAAARQAKETTALKAKLVAVMMEKEAASLRAKLAKLLKVKEAAKEIKAKELWEEAQALQFKIEEDRVQAQQKQVQKAIEKEKYQRKEEIIKKQLRVRAEVTRVKEQLRKAEALIRVIEREKAQAEERRQVRNYEQPRGRFDRFEGTFGGRNDLERKAQALMREVKALRERKYEEEENEVFERTRNDYQVNRERQKLQRLIKARKFKSASQPKTLFDLLDRNWDSKLKVAEVTAILSEADFDGDSVVTPSELLSWLVQREDSLCSSYLPIIDQLMQIRP